MESEQSDQSEQSGTMVLDVGGLASRRRLSRAERWRVPLCAAGTLLVFGGGALFLASGGGGLTGSADRGASAPDGPLRENLGPAAASGSAGAHSPGSAASSAAGSPSTGPGGSPAPQGGSAAADRAGSATPQGAGSDGGGRSPDGDPGSHTPGPPVPPVPPSPAPSDGTLRPGDRGAEVRSLQQRLYGQGFTFVPVDGVYGEQTRLGVAKLQSDRGLTGDPSGIYGPHTRAAFGLG
ncbi:peptidoglycan-binding protein [Streptomyces sp. NPDC098789]|uniref:peptidoglycan-binding domain-containing protein n=1 Tax=Streptomyces sp. NPDC098789 TaxID=3366098 RepID=UPI0037FE067B